MAYRLQLLTSVVAAMASVATIQPAVAQVTQINQVQVNAVNDALEVRLEIAGGEMPRAFTTSYGETVVVDLINTQLNLPTGDRIVQANPTAGIELIRVAPLDANSVRITITGGDQAPTATLVQANGELVMSVSTPDAVVDQSPEEPTDESTHETNVQSPVEEGIRIVVTGDQDTD